MGLARALGRAVARIPCGELEDADALRGAPAGRPGRIVEELRRVGVGDPVFVLDEVDRVEKDSGLPAALAELLDWERRAAFRDRYLDVPFDLSEALFVATASHLREAPPVLREHFAAVRVPGYTEEEKTVIAVEHLLPRVLGVHGLRPEHLELTEPALRAVVRGYTGEPGLWSLMAALATLCRKVARRRAEGDESVVAVTPETVAGFLGTPPAFDVDFAERTRRPGVAVGLGWTVDGGDVLFMEVGRMAGAGELTLTGSLGDMMKESARTAMSWMRANAERYGVDPAFYKDMDFHLHVQADMGSKDGVSGGAAMVAALASSLTGRPVRGDLAMTGEITLSGQVLPVGAVKEKVLAARRRGLTAVVLPRQNEQEVDEELDEDVRRQLTVHYVRRIDELLELVLRDVEAEDRRAPDSTPFSRPAG